MKIKNLYGKSQISYFSTLTLLSFLSYIYTHPLQFLNLKKFHYSSVMNQSCNFHNSFFYDSQVEELRKAFKRKKEHKSTNYPFIAVLLLFL